VLGQFLEFSVYSPDIQESLDFYRNLGFSELETGDVWSHRYAVVTDGDLCIGLHDRVFDAPALTFVHQELAKRARAMSDHGFSFSFLKVDEDVFNELGLPDRDGNMITMIEARTFSAPMDDVPDSLCGNWFELSLPVRDAMHAGRFWAPIAPKVLRIREDPTTHMRFDAGGMSLGVSESIALTQPSPCFRCADRNALETAIRLHGLKHEKFPGFEGAFVAIEAPEGTTLFMFDEDFLGELYEVSETDDADYPA
jgi:catechol 2,3-dioxygenase-like lactoylglutathione lyase family enzyme